ncbi:MAG: DUF1972 domain-containing protein [Oscillospiraceae bacterium]|nr:DUF1972 domain-containing protein [Oscillospiraceae bacterium]
MQDVFIVGSKGIPGNYGGYETFVDKLTEYHQNAPNIRYHVACAVDDAKDVKDFKYHNAHCFTILRKKIGPAQAIFYDIDALQYCIDYIKSKKISKPIIYVLACRIGPFFNQYVKQIHMLGGMVYVNPDGHEWMRAKWSAPVRKYWKISEQLMVKYSDLLVCDSKNIEKYIQQTYSKYSPKTTFIAYGAETRRSTLLDNDEKLLQWYQEKGIEKKKYYLVVGRFVPENNYETMIREFMRSKTNKDFALITNVSDKFLEELKKKTGFHKDKRIKFVGTVYDKELLMKIRENAYGYFHGHEVGGTNPSLLEALGSTDINLLLDVGFNREVAGNTALYWNKESGNLAKLIEKTDMLSEKEIQEYGQLSTKRIQNEYSWEFICSEYRKLFIQE